MTNRLPRPSPASLASVFGIKLVVGPEVDELFRGELVRRDVAKRPASGQRPYVNEQAGDELIM